MLTTFERVFSILSLRESDIAALEDILCRIAPNETPKLVEAIDRRLKADFSDADLFHNVLPERTLTDEMKAERHLVFSQIARKNLRVLELGTWTAWPDERVRKMLLGEPSRFGGYSEIIRLDYDASVEPDLVASAYAIPLREGSVDFVRSNSLLEHVRDPLMTLKECYSVLAPGGFMQHVMPLHFPLHGYPKDYCRLTPDYFADFCREIGFEDIVVSTDGCSGRIYTSLNFMNSFNLNVHPERVKLVEFLKVALLLLSEMDLDDHDKSAVAHSIYVRGRKPGVLQERPAKRDDSGVLMLPPGSTTLLRIAGDIVDPITKQALDFDGNSFRGALTYPVKDKRIGYLREIDAQSAG